MCPLLILAFQLIRHIHNTVKSIDLQHVQVKIELQLIQLLKLIKVIAFSLSANLIISLIDKYYPLLKEPGQILFRRFKPSEPLLSKESSYFSHNPGKFLQLNNVPSERC